MCRKSQLKVSSGKLACVIDICFPVATSILKRTHPYAVNSYMTDLVTFCAMNAFVLENGAFNDILI